MPKYTLTSESSLEEEGFYEKRTYEFRTDGHLDQLVFHTRLWYNMEGYPAAEKVVVVKDDGGTVDSEGGW